MPTAIGVIKVVAEGILMQIPVMSPPVHDTHISVAVVTGVTGVDCTTGGIFIHTEPYVIKSDLKRIQHGQTSH